MPLAPITPLPRPATATTLAPADQVPHQPLFHLDALWIQVAGTLCNLSCTHCFVSSGPGDDHHARAELLKLKGVGNWTIDIYLLMALGRPDIWPSGDLALAVAFQKIKGLSSRPTPAELEEHSLNWRPWRAVAARLLWHYYLAERDSRRR